MGRKIFKTGHSYAITLSRKIMEILGLQEGDAVTVEANETLKSITIKKDKIKDQLELGLNIRPKLGAKRTANG